MCIVIQPMKKKYHQTWIFSEISVDFPFLRGVSRVFPNKGFQAMGPEKSPNPKTAEVNKFVEEIQNILYAKAKRKKRVINVDDRGNCYISYKGCSKKLSPTNHSRHC